MLPLILKRAMILAAVCLAVGGIIAFCTVVIRNAGNEETKLHIGYVAEENTLTEFAVSYVQDMESVKNLCSLDAVTEQEGKKLLQGGSLSALIVLPEDVVNEILSGKNTPAKLYLPRQERSVLAGGLNTVGSILFEELVSSGMGMLGTAQAQIYASSSILTELTQANAENGGINESVLLQSMYDDINQFNLGVVTSREELFRTKSLSLTENDTYAVYYGSAFLTIYTMLAGLFLGAFCKRSSFWQTMADRRIGVGYAVQLISRCLAGSILMLAAVLIPFLAFAIPKVRIVLSCEITPAGVIALMLVTVFMTIYNMMIYQMVEKRQSAIVVSGVLALLQAYMCGCLIPSVLLPKAIVTIGRLLPASFIKKAFTILLAGGVKDIGAVAAGLVIWGLILFCITILSMHIGNRESAASAVKTKKHPAGIHVPSASIVLLRRFLHKKSIWLCMIFFAVVSVMIIQVEKSSGTQIIAAVYDESGDYKKLLDDYDGLIRFEIYDDMEQMTDAVRRGNVECGYFLPENLAEDMIARRANRCITVYQDEDAVAVPVVNEIIFERIFRQVSFEWYENYIIQNDAIKKFEEDRTVLEKIVRDCFDRELLSGTTFRFEIERVDIDGEQSSDKENNNNEGVGERQATYPLYLTAAAAVVLCALQGAAQVAADIRDKRFYKRNRAAMSALTIILPILTGTLFFAAVIVGLLILLGHVG